ncbi:hypothetical protein TrLO_g10324 [Triparma laevis f. longispina]|uniref:Uncharacterized protein n=1 Tax=Triparma laevis f. longispina TaxID=1714387 RepID=A0A9W6ZNM6_9STRA|nr:hypothetical protein TrLO_g10324 [Triparma laevis f. longispina]
MPAVLRDLELLDFERRSLMNENDTKAPSLIWDESSLISRSATETDDVLESKDLSSETAKMLAYALDKVEKYTSTASLANDDTKHYHRADSTKSQPNPVVVMPSTAGSTRSLRTPSRSPQQTHSYLNLAKSLPGGSPIGSERWDITRTRTSQDMMAMASRAESESPTHIGRTVSRQGSMKLSVKPGTDMDTGNGKFSPEKDRELAPETSDALEAATTSGFVVSHEVASCEEIWVQNYGSDLQKYTSVSLWADTAHAETRTLVDSQTLPASALAAMSAQLLVDIEHKLVSAHGPVIHDVVDEILSSVFILSDGDGNPTCEAARKILERNLWVPGRTDMTEEDAIKTNNQGTGQLTMKHPVFAEGGLGVRKRLELFMSCPTFYDQMRYLWGNLKKEIVVRPPCHRKMQSMRAERLMETRLITRACDRWAKGIIVVCFDAWRLEVNIGHEREKKGKYMLMMMSLSVKDVFKVWKKWAKENKRYGEMDGVAKAKEKVELTKAEIKKLHLKNAGGIGGNRKARNLAETAKRKVVDALAIYEMPARQIGALHKVVKGFGKAFEKFARFQDSQHQYHIEDMFRKDEDTTRLAPLYKWKSVGPNEEAFKRGRRPSLGGRPSDLLDPGKFETETDCDDNDEETIRKWIPGTFASVEKTPAFKPFETRAGRRTKRWLNNCLRTFVYENNLPKSKMCREWTDMENGTLLETLMLHLTKKSPQVDKDLQQGYAEMAANEEQLHKDNVEEVSKEFYKNNPSLLKCWSLLKYCMDNFSGACRHIDQNHLTNLTRPKTQLEVDKHEKRMASLAMRAKETGIIVHVMSQYMGQRIHVLHIHEPMTFAMVAELFCTFFKDCQDMIGEQDHIQKLYNKNLLQNRELIRNQFMELSMRGPTHWDHAQLLGIAGKVKTLYQNFADPDEFLMTQWVKCLDDRLRYRAHLPELVRLVWQSVCTTVLSRKVRTEEDLDDGTFTTVDALQLKSEFKRNGIINEIAIEEECAGITAVLKNRIRDLKRIFQFYAAAGDGGPATSMDNAEFWKFVKDVKLQKDRQKLPSVRVDLIFQACNIDYSLEGADRIASDDGELDPGEWVEGLCRLCMYRYTKGSVASRLEKMLNEDILPNACSLDIDVFRERLAGDRVKDTLTMHKMNMKPVFVEYAADDDTDGACDSLESMNSKELVTYCRDLKLCGAPPALSERAIKTLFAFCQQEEEEIEEGEAETQSDSEQVYSEYMETNAAIGSQMRPDPYNVLEIRIDQYLCELVHPVSITLQRFRGKGLLTVERLKEKWIEKLQRDKEKEEGGGGGGDDKSASGSRPGSAKDKGSRGSGSNSRRPSFSGSIKE